MKSINPATEQLIREYAEHERSFVEERLQRAEKAFIGWRALAFADRAAVLHRSAEVLNRRRSELALLMTQEMGKPIAASESEVDKCADCGGNLPPRPVLAYLRTVLPEEGVSYLNLCPACRRRAYARNNSWKAREVEA